MKEQILNSCQQDPNTKIYLQNNNNKKNTKINNEITLLIPEIEWLEVPGLPWTVVPDRFPSPDDFEPSANKSAGYWGVLLLPPRPWTLLPRSILSEENKSLKLNFFYKSTYYYYKTISQKKSCFVAIFIEEWHFNDNARF